MTVPSENPGRDGLHEIGVGECDSLRHLAEWGAVYLEKCGVPNAHNNAGWILSDAANCDRLQIYVGASGDVPQGVGERYLSNLRRRARREPLQYILGETEFMSLLFHTPPGVFVPRPDTEILVEEMESRLRGMPLLPCLHVVDLCCGSGVIAISLARRIPNLEAWAVDSNAWAVDVTTMNATANGVEARVHVVNETAARFLSADTGADHRSMPPARGRRIRFSAVVCNPPYIATPDVSDLPPEVRDHEPIEALDGGPDGLEFYRRIVPMLPMRIMPGGVAAFEIGETQGEAVTALMEAAGFKDVTVTPDYAGRDRVVVGTQPA